MNLNTKGYYVVERPEVLNKILVTTKQKRYLEIGVQNGYTFHQINAQSKVAVDPAFLFDVEAEKAAATCEVAYHEMLSDTYFAEVAGPDEQFDVIFIDGLHTFDQTLRDLMNAVLHVPTDGVIVIDDVLPNSYAASLFDNHDMIAFNQAIGETSMAWMGDVYRLVFFIRHFMPGYSYATVAENHGQTVLWREPRTIPAPGRSMKDVVALEYFDTVTKRADFNILPLAAILERLSKRG